MWRYLLAWALLLSALVLACESEAPPLSTIPLEDGGLLEEGGIGWDAEREDAAAGDASPNDGGKRDAKVDAEFPLGSCIGALPNDACNIDGGGKGICCSGACVSPFDKDHCGACSTKCGADEACRFGGGCAGPTCKPGRTSCLTPNGMGGCCDGTDACTDLQKNAAHCGQCGKACATGETCQAGSCVLSNCTGAPGGTLCVSSAGIGGKCCGGVCTNTSTETLHCGGCGEACPVGLSCTNGQCVDSAGTTTWCVDASAPACATGKVCLTTPGRCGEVACDGANEEGALCALPAGAAGACCGAGCADLGTDREHCGRCGNACATNEWCNRGYCTAKVTCTTADSNKACNLPNDTGGLCCDGACIDGKSPDNCGQCGWGCKLGTTCRADGGACVDAKGTPAACTSSAQCATGRTCLEGLCVLATCATGASGRKCAFGAWTSARNGTCCNGECVDVAQDKDACGGCGQACPSGLCVSATCLPTPRACGAGACLAGQQCVDGTCVSVSGCAGAMTGFCAATGGGLGLCCPTFSFGAACEDIKNDANNCGGCNVRCPYGQTCKDGVCSGATGICTDSHQGAFCDRAFGESKQCCGGGCVDVKGDTKNCGRCGRMCDADESCVGGSCTLTSCQGVTSARACSVGGTTGVCCGGACADTKTSESHCGQCNKGCGTGAECRASKCAVPACSSPTTGAPCFLTGDVVGRCCAASSCVDVTTDEDNCLGCGIKCAAGQVCKNGCQ